MKVGIFQNVRGGIKRFSRSAQKYEGEIELVGFDCNLTEDTVQMVEGCEAIIYTPTTVQQETFWQKLSAHGVKYVVTSSVGYDHFDLEAMKKYEIKAANVPYYSPNAIAEHAVLTLLALLRKYREQLERIDNKNYDLTGLMGKEVRNQVIGVVGTGRIGFTTLKCLSGFTPKLLASDPYESVEVAKYAEYVSIDEMYKRADVIIYHCIYNEENHHMVNKDAIAKMKDGVILINMARGGLFDIDAVYEAVTSNKISALGIDVIEHEDLLRKHDVSSESPAKILEQLLVHRNVIFTNHTAFYTDEAEKNMTDTAMSNLYAYMQQGTCDFELVK